MRNYTQKDIKTLFSNLCCSQCKNEFTKESLEILEREKGLMICRLKCEKCGKDFGEILFNFNRKADKHPTLEITEGAKPIDYNDVIAAHRFIKNEL